MYPRFEDNKDEVLYMKTWNDEKDVNWDLEDELNDKEELLRNLENLNLPSIMDVSWPAARKEDDYTLEEEQIWTSIQNSKIEFNPRKFT